MRILFEYTDVFKRPERNVGIPRVVRNIANNLHGIESACCIPIVSGKTKIYNAQSIVSPEEHARQVYRISLLLGYADLKLRQWHNHLGSMKRVARWAWVQKMLSVGFSIGSRLISLLRKICQTKRKKSTFNRLPVIDIQPGDIVIWPGTLSSMSGCYQLQKYKFKGAHIVIIIYDLFQITPHEHHSNAKFECQVPPMMLIADGFMAISATVLQKSREYIQENVLPVSNTNPWTDQFYLGSELDIVTKENHTRALGRLPFKAGKPLYLMVGTILPHKNHAYVLDAFERLWGEDVDVALCIVGKSNEKHPEVVKRVKNHQEWNKRLFMLNDASDSELEYYYRNSKALVFPSVYEGFGLPLVEAMQHGLPVMASDIPIFRELGGKFVAYFDLSNPQMLCDYILEFEQSNVFPAVQPVSEWKWLTWKESAQQLIERIMQQEMSR